MAEHLLYICNKCKKRKDESAFPYKLKACDKCTDATGQYYREQQVLTIRKNACPECGAMYSRVRIESDINRSYGKFKVCWRNLKQLSL